MNAPRYLGLFDSIFIIELFKMLIIAVLELDYF